MGRTPHVPIVLFITLPGRPALLNRLPWARLQWRNFAGLEQLKKKPEIPGAQRVQLYQQNQCHKSGIELGEIHLSFRQRIRPLPRLNYPRHRLYHLHLLLFGN